MAGERGIYERRAGSGVWYIRYADEDGKIRKERAGLKSAARDLLALRRRQVSEGKSPVSLGRAPRLEDFVREVYFGIVDAELKDAERPKQRAIWWTKRLGRKRVTAITPNDVREARNALLRQGKAPATCNRYHAVIKRILSLALANDSEKVNPASRVPLLRENNARERWLQDWEEAPLLLALANLERKKTDRGHWRGRAARWHRSGVLADHVIVAVNTGLRQSEQLGIRWNRDVDLRSGRLTVPESKSGSRRTVPLNSEARGALRRLRVAGWFVSAAPLSARSLVLAFRRACESVGIEDLRWHDLRHTFGYRLAMAGHREATIRELMGHKSVTMCHRYMHVSDRHLSDAAESIVRRK